MRLRRPCIAAIATALALGAAPALADDDAGAPSFDCQKAEAPIEIAICTNATLAALDGALGRAYAARRDAASGTARKALQDEQRAWLGRRKSCPLPADPETDRPGLWAAVPCLADLYRARIAALGGRLPPQPEASDADVVPPLCIGALWGQSPDAPPTTVDLAQCRAALAGSPVDRVPTGYLVQTRTDFRYPAGWFAYRDLGTLDDGSWLVLVSDNGGGTGDFSALLRLQRDGEQLSLVSDMGFGDRCNGGVREAGLLDERHVMVAMNVTSYGLAVLDPGLQWPEVGDPPDRPVPFDDLDDAAVACVGVGLYVVDALDATATRLGAVIDRIPPTDEGGGRLQGCLADAVRYAAPEAPGTLDSGQVAAMQSRFEKVCLSGG